MASLIRITTQRRAVWAYVLNWRQMNLLVCVLLLCSPIDTRAQWIQIQGTEGQTIHTFVSKGSILFAGGSPRFVTNGVYVGGALRSTDGGTTWVEITNGIPSGVGHPVEVYSLAVKDSLIFAGKNYGIFVSSNNGDSWSQTSFNTMNGTVHCLLVIGSDLYAGTDVGEWASFPQDTLGGVFRSTDNGNSWIPINAGFRSSNGRAGRVISMLNIGTELYAGTWGQGIFYSANGGHEWVHRWSNADVTSLALIDSLIFAGTWYGAVFRSSDKGMTWAPCDSGLTDPTTGYPLSVQSLAARGRNLFAGTIFDGVFLSTDLGGSWSRENRGLPGAPGADIDIHSLAVFGEFLYAGTVIGGIWRRPLEEMVTSVEMSLEQAPRRFQLEPNYPNPFNPSTTLRYGLPRAAHVALVVYNTLGQKVAELVDGEVSPGYHEARWEAGGLASGIYFARLTVTGALGQVLTTQTAKLVLMK